MFTTLEGGNTSLVSKSLFGLAFAQFIGLIFFKVFVIIKRSEKVMACFRRLQRMTGSCMSRQLFRERWNLTVKGKKANNLEAMRVCQPTDFENITP